MKIPLPQVRVRDNPLAHPYPFQLAFQTMEFMQSVMFHTIIGDISSGEFMKQEGSIDALRKICSNTGIGEAAWEHGWECLGKYKSIFEKTSYHNTLIGFNSHWDWYVRNIGKFVLFSRQHVNSPEMNHKDRKNLEHLGFNPILKQIDLLRNATGVEAKIADDDIANLKEMTLVRNLSLHNRCEVDKFYLEKTVSNNYEYGDLRLVEVIELMSWRKSITSVIRILAREIAIKYKEVPICDCY